MFSHTTQWSNSNSFDPKGAAIVKTYPYWFSPDGTNQRVTGLW